MRGARRGDVALAQKSEGELARLRDALKAAKNDYWATEVEVSRVGVAAWPLTTWSIRSPLRD